MFRPWQLIPLLGLLWGSSYLWIAILADAFAPPMVMLLRTVAALLVVGAIASIGRKRLPPFGRMWIHLLVVTISADIVPFLMLIWAQRTVSSSVAAVLNSTIPLFTLLIAALAFRSETITRERLIGILLGIAGVCTLAGTTPDAGPIVSPGVVAVTLSSMFYGFGFVYARRHLRGNPFGIVALQMALTLPILIPIVYLSGSIVVSGVSTKVALAVIGLGALSSGVAYAIYYLSLDRLGPTTTSFATYLSPIVAMVIGWLALGDRLGWLGFAGVAIIALGVLTAAGLTRSGARFMRRYARVLGGQTSELDPPPADAA